MMSRDLRREKLREEIEKYVGERRVLKAKAGILTYLRSAGRSNTAKFEACEWYRRLGLYSEAYRLVRWEDRLPTKVTADSTAGRRLLWNGWMLNAMGAGSVAASFLERLTITEAADHRIAAEIFLTQFQPKAALIHYRRMLKLELQPERYSSRLSRVGFADALSVDHQFDEAIQIVRDVRGQSPEPLLQGICLSAEGEYLARAGRFSEGLKRLEAATEFVPRGEYSIDSALLEKWLGYCLLKTGKKVEGEAMIRRSEAFFKETAVRPEAWGDIIRLRADSGIASADEVTRLARYPGWSSGFQKGLPAAPGLRIGPENAPIEIALGSDEFKLGESRFLGVPKELELLAGLRVAADWGFPIPSAITWLWPDEAFAFLELEDRLFQLLRRLRLNYRIQFEVRNRRIYLDPKSCAETAVVWSRVRVTDRTQRPSFLEQCGGTFRASEVSAYYTMKKSAASLWLQKWLKQKWIVKSGKGRASVYTVSKPT